MYIEEPEGRDWLLPGERGPVQAVRHRGQVSKVGRGSFRRDRDIRSRCARHRRAHRRSGHGSGRRRRASDHADREGPGRRVEVPRRGARRFRAQGRPRELDALRRHDRRRRAAAASRRVRRRGGAPEPSDDHERATILPLGCRRHRGRHSRRPVDRVSGAPARAQLRPRCRNGRSCCWIATTCRPT